MFERLSERSSITFRTAVIKCSEAPAPIGWNIEHPHQLAGARLAAPILGKLGFDRDLAG